MTQANTQRARQASGPARLPSVPGFRPVEKLIELSLLLAAVFSVFITAGIAYVLFSEAIPFFRDERVSVWGF